MEYEGLFDLKGRVVLVVGAGSGIGQASAQGLAAHGAHVICADVNLDAAEATAKQIASQGKNAKAVKLDITQDLKTIEDTVKALGAIDVLVSTPSINVRKPLLQYTEEEFDRVINLNLKGTFKLLKVVASGMVQRKRGSIIVFASIRAEVVEPGQSIYAATKAGMRQMCRGLASEVGPQGVRVNVLAPGVVETPLTMAIRNNKEWYDAYANKNIFKRWAQPSELVGAVVYLASDASSYVTGSVITVDGGWTAADGRYDPPATAATPSVAKL
eukprot:TRINITY_DN14750_c0_g1_i1.p1 TRINITY_DN14750_c0_g1~~TRINITY_DN14750_c0_g1_i1.p1  ORF type:complete len:271 (-),score=65.22 TRINITY_DN14750_c0_g1_i1:118-930(-)